MQRATRVGNRVRVTAQLIQVSTDMHLWADTYERDVSEILDLQGRLAAGDPPCGNWTSNAGTGGAMVGHHDRQGGGANPTSWNSAHASSGCGQANLQKTGGDGLFYCFAAK